MGKQNRDLQGFMGEPEKVTPEPKAVKTQLKHERSKSRQGKKMASVFIDKAVHNQLKLLTIETDKNIQELQIEALNLLFSSYNKPTIAK